MRAVANFRQRASSGHFDCAGRMSDLGVQRTLARRGLPQGAACCELTDQPTGKPETTSKACQQQTAWTVAVGFARPDLQVEGQPIAVAATKSADHTE
jgi:hypothetical protein